MSIHKRITRISARVTRELVISVFALRLAASSVATDVRHVVGWARFAAGL